MKKVILASILLLAILTGLQVRSYRHGIELNERAGAEANSLADLRVLQIATNELHSQISRQREALNAIAGLLGKNAVAEELKLLRIASGEEEVRGEGIEITFSTSIRTYWITDLIAQLVASGAEAIAVNDVRITPATFGLREVAGGLVMRHDFFKPPLRITALGPSKELQQLLAQTGGIFDRLQAANPSTKILLARRDLAVIPAIRSN